MADGDETDQEDQDQEQPGFENLGVVSSCFSALAYNSATKQLQMTFAKDGKSYIIEEIEAIEVERWKNNLSPGGYFNLFVRGNY